MLINATSSSSGPQTAGPTPHERGRRAFSYGVGTVVWGPELDEVALINISLSLAYWTIDYRFVVTDSGQNQGPSQSSYTGSTRSCTLAPTAATTLI